jgi:hypothetical protein
MHCPRSPATLPPPHPLPLPLLLLLRQRQLLHRMQALTLLRLPTLLLPSLR